MSSTSHRRKERLFPLTFFRKWREHFFISRGLELLSSQFLKNLHITEEDEYVKEHSLVKFPKYHWNAKEAKALNFRPDTLDLAIQEGESEKLLFLKNRKIFEGKNTQRFLSYLEPLVFSVLTMGTRERYHQRSKIKFVSHTAIR